MTTALPHVLSLAPLDLAAHLGVAGEPGFRARQVVEWIYGQRTLDPQAMANLPQALRTRLTKDFSWELPEVVSRMDGADGSTKFLLKTERGLIESVILRYAERTSLCVSSQVGCRLACTFCQTGKLGFVRDLGTHEILAQYAIADAIVRAEGRRLSHVVYMGMGEPLDNYDAVVQSARRLTSPSPEGYGLSARHVTVSTSGIVPKIRELAKDARVALAVSLHASRDSLRTELMPINRRWPLADLKAALVDYQRETGNKITIEYILIQGKNCGPTEAKELVAFLNGLRAKVNLIPFNAHPGLPHARPTDDEIRTFQKYLADRSIPAPVRYSKGLEVSGACGQLAAKASEAVLAAIPARARLLGREAP